MSTKYPGGFITKSPVAPTTTAASGIWTLDQQQQAQKAGTWPSPPIFIEDMFSTYLYTGNGTSQTITNGIDLSGQGGLTWIKCRNYTWDHILNDTVRGAGYGLFSDLTAGQVYDSTTLTNFSSSGFSVGNSNATNENNKTFVSWTFREQPKFFDIVTYTGNGTARTISHNLGSVPGCIIVKSTSSSDNWKVYHRSLTSNAYYILLDSTAAQSNAVNLWNNTTPTSTEFSISSSGNINNTGSTYIAYLFAHDAGGFPVSGGGSTNGISCGSATIDGGGQATVNLGYEPQWILYKSSSDIQNWYIYDTMRGMPVGTTSGPYSNALSPNATTAEFLGAAFAITPTGFNIQTSIAGATYIYIAIRRGPMKTPTTGTSVYNGIARTGTGTTATVSGVGFPPDLFIGQIRGTAGYWNGVVDRLRGVNKRLVSSNTNTEDTTTDAVTSFTMDGSTLGADSNGFVNESGKTYIEWNFRRAPGFFDEVCYTGNGLARTITHNLGVAPELIIIKNRTNGGTIAPDWPARAVGLGSASTLFLNLTDPAAGYLSYMWNNAYPTSTGFELSVDNYMTNSSTGSTYVAWLFASCPGVSKVGQYTGTGAAQTINCGFTAGARFVLIKRSDNSGDWYVWDSARGIIPANDPYLLLNSSAAEVTGTDYIDTTNVGFDITSTAPAGINANGGTFIFLAIA